MANNELQLLNPDQELALAIKNGDITKEEVERIWANTTDMSANTPIATRRAVLLMKQAGSFEKAWPIFYKEVMRQNSEIMAAFNRDESKFSHLVAGTEAIVKTMQNLNPLQQRLDDMARMMFEMREELRELRADKQRSATLTPEEIELVLAGLSAYDQNLSCSVEESRPYHALARKLTQALLPARPAVEEEPRADGVRRADADADDYEAEAEQARKDSIGSAWAK